LPLLDCGSKTGVKEHPEGTEVNIRADPV
jgi:hypothetical protein